MTEEFVEELVKKIAKDFTTFLDEEWIVAVVSRRTRISEPIETAKKTMSNIKVEKRMSTL